MVDKTAREVFVKNLRHYMEEREVSQADIASRMGLTASTVSDWYKGKNYPRVDAMQRLATILDISMRELTTETEEDFSLSPDESALISDYRQLSPDGKTYIRQTMAMAVQTYGKNHPVSGLADQA